MFTYYSGHKVLLPRKILNENSYINKPLISVGIVLGTLLDIQLVGGHLLWQVSPSRTPVFFQVLTLAMVQLWCALDLFPVQFLCMLLSDMGIGDLNQKTWFLCLPCCFPAVWQGNQISPLSLSCLIYKMGREQYSPRLIVKVNQCYLLRAGVAGGGGGVGVGGWGYGGGGMGWKHNTLQTVRVLWNRELCEAWLVILSLSLFSGMYNISYNDSQPQKNYQRELLRIPRPGLHSQIFLLNWFRVEPSI